MTQEEKDVMIARLKEMEQTQGWRIIKDHLDEHIEGFVKQILHGFNEQTMEDVNLSRSALKIYEEMADIPQKMIKQLTAIEKQDEKDEADPYE